MQTKVLFYNVENLFDTLDDPLTNDNAFLPNSALKWEQKRYVVKLQRIARVLKEVEDPMPGIVGLAEVENRKVLEDLIFTLRLTDKEVGIAHIDSPDERGIDVALLYRKDLFSLSDDSPVTPITVSFDDDLSDKTRDILYVPLLNKQGGLLQLYVNHWPSRKEGKKISMKKRFSAANALRQHIDYKQTEDSGSQILVMGDLNCTPDSPPVYKVLDEKGHPENPLLNMSWDIHLSNSGSTNYRGKWLMFDQFLATPNLLNPSFKHLNTYTLKRLKTIAFSWMLYYNPKFNDYRPNKTYGGRNYHGGFSDHLPVTVELHWDERKTPNSD